eukprot:9467434-Pyramimonas_sp.AAC.1
MALLLLVLGPAGPQAQVVPHPHSSHATSMAPDWDMPESEDGAAYPEFIDVPVGVEDAAGEEEAK